MRENSFPRLINDNSKVALVEGENSYTYSEVNRHIDRFATGLLNGEDDLREERIAFFGKKFTNLQGRKYARRDVGVIETEAESQPLGLRDRKPPIYVAAEGIGGKRRNVGFVVICLSEKGAVPAADAVNGEVWIEPVEAQ